MKNNKDHNNNVNRIIIIEYTVEMSRRLTIGNEQ